MVPATQTAVQTGIFGALPSLGTHAAIGSTPVGVRCLSYAFARPPAGTGQAGRLALRVRRSPLGRSSVLAAPLLLLPAPAPAPCICSLGGLWLGLVGASTLVSVFGLAVSDGLSDAVSLGIVFVGIFYFLGRSGIGALERVERRTVGSGLIGISLSLLLGLLLGLLLTAGCGPP